jgi:hypothetical protein
MDGNTFRPAQGAELTFLAESESAKSSHFIVLDDFGDGWNHTIKLDKFTDLPSDIEILFDRHKTSLQLLDRRHRLAGHPGEGLNFSFQGTRLGRVLAMFEGVAVSLRSAAAGTVHPADAIGPSLPAIGTVARSFSTWRGISTLGAYPRAWG